MTAQVFKHGLLNTLNQLLKPTSQKRLLSKELLLIDNAPGHPRALGEMHNEANVAFVPANPTSLL